MVKCHHEGCDSRPSFDIKGGKGRFCYAHKTSEMIDVKHKRCEHEGCDSRPSFNIKGGKGRFCAVHKTTEMVDVSNKRCEHEGCDSVPNYNIKGGKGRFCSQHKTAEMIDVKHKRCEHEGCDFIPSFDIKGGKGRFCLAHKTAEMVDVRSKKCEYEGCDSLTPSFDIKGSKKGRFCLAHKTAEMVDVRSKKCEHEGCDFQPVFNIKGIKTGRFCASHKSPEMVDVISKKCEHEGCETTASYGNPGNKKSHCFPHRQKGMIRRPNAKCCHSKCKEMAIWGTNWVPKHCELHRTSDDKNLVERPCANCGLVYVLDDSNKCEYCNPESFEISRLAKQNALMSHLDYLGLVGESTDKKIDNGICGAERPDRVYDLGDKILVLECDENQHQYRACLCEQTRMVNIGQQFGGVPVYFIRFNPDDYSPENDRKPPEDIKKRYKLLGDLICDIKNNRHSMPRNFVSAIYLYYDGWSSLAETEWQPILKLIIE